MRALSRGSTATVFVGWLLALGGVVLPWTANRRSGQRWLPELLERHPGVVLLYAAGLAALSIALVVTARGSSPITALLATAAAALAMAGAAAATPRPDTIWDGMDSTGRPIGGSDPTVFSSGAAAAVLGVVVALVAAAVRAGRVRP